MLPKYSTVQTQIAQEAYRFITWFGRQMNRGVLSYIIVVTNGEEAFIPWLEKINE